MISEGYRIYEIVNKLGVSRHIVRHIKEGNTWTHISCEYDFTNFNNGILKPSDIDVIIDLIQKNKTYKEINELTGYTSSYILDVINHFES